MKKNGFSLVELVVTIGIIGILSGIAIPAYMSYTKRANRTDATRAMTVISQQLERCYSQAFTYIGCATAPAGSNVSAQGYYTLTTAVQAATYTLTAVPLKAPQLSDTTCKTFTLTGAGTQGATDASNNNTTATCWGST